MVITRQFTRNAREYLHTVRDKFEDNREIYDTFIKVLKDLHSKRIGHRDVISKVIELFKGHQDLILGFNRFLPKCYTLTLGNDQTPQMMSESQEAVDFLNKVKARLQDDRAFRSFLKILRMYREKKKSFTEVFHKVYDVVLRDHHDLRVEFAAFLRRRYR